MISIIKKLVPKPIFKLYHYALAVMASFIYRNPSDKLIVIGVTGTSGKSTTVFLIGKILEKAGFKVGSASTMMFKLGKEEWWNNKKMTMIGRFALQKLIYRMVKANCQYAIIETTSQGIDQFRHLGINYDILVFTNLWPEHIEAHGGFDNYKKAKLKLFKKLERESPKLIAGQKIKKTIIANLDDEHVQDFLNHKSDEKYGYTLDGKKSSQGKVIRTERIKADGRGVEFEIDGQHFESSILGRHNIYNLVSAITVGLSQGLSYESMAEGILELKNIPGRIEFIESKKPFKVIVDYAYEPKALEALYQVAEMIPHEKIIHVLGSAGGGRDAARRPKLGNLAGAKADYVIVTNEDPYDDDPNKIIDQVAKGAKESGKVEKRNLFKIKDRRLAIEKALGLARPKDIVLITGKGSEQAIAVKNNKKIPWDDRTVAREELEKI